MPNTTDVNTKTVATKITASTEWNGMFVESGLNEKYLEGTGAKVVAALQDFDALLSLEAIVFFYERLGGVFEIASKSFMADFFSFARLQL